MNKHLNRILLTFLVPSLSLFASIDEEDSCLDIEEDDISTEVSDPNPPPFLGLNDAVIRTLENQKEIQISILNIKNQAGVLQESAGPFDPTLNQIASMTVAQKGSYPPPIHYVEHDYDVDTAVTKRTRLGTSFTIANQEEFIKDSFGNGISARQRNSNVLFRVDQPLLRNFIYGIERQREEANKYELEAVQWDTLFLISERILDTINRYWDVVASKQNLAVQRKGVDRLERVLQITKNLIQASILAPSDLDQVLVNLAQQQTNVVIAEQQLYVDQQNLLLSMGEVDEDRCCGMDRRLNVLNKFPPLPLDLDGMIKKIDCLTQTAITKRFDILAAKFREAEAKALLKGARNQALPQLNAFGSVARRDNRSSSRNPKIIPSSSIARSGETDWTVGVAISVPFYNDAALGFLRQQEAQTSQAFLRTQLLKQNVITALLQSIHNQISLKREILLTEDAVKLFETVLKNETRKLEAGFGSVFFLLSFETQLTSAQAQLVFQYRDYMQNLARIRFQTGTLLTVDDCFGPILFDESWSFPFEL